MDGSILITPQEMLDAGTTLGNLRGSLEDVVTQINNLITNVEANWKGASQNAFVDRYNNELYPVLSKTAPEVINGIASMLTGTANSMLEADRSVADSINK